MELFNATRMPAEYAIGTEPSGREHLVVLVKGTFDIPASPDESPELSAEQLPVLLCDVLGGQSGSLPIAEADLAMRKPRCDVLVEASAYAPGGTQSSRVQVGVRVGGWTKRFHVTGHRRWIRGAFGVRPSASEPYSVMPISYECAFGGMEISPTDSARDRRPYRQNPVGCGYYSRADEVPDGAPMPNTEEIDRPVEKPDGNYVPMALGPIGRNWFPRYRLAGTYDQRWLDHVFPFLPIDFDERYYQSAPPDQQIPYPSGGEEVVLVNLSPEGRLAFRLPRAEASVIVAPRDGDQEKMPAVIDTILIEAERRRFSVCWRCTRALRRNLFEIDEVIIGRVSSEVLREREGLPPPDTARGVPPEVPRQPTTADSSGT